MSSSTELVVEVAEEEDGGIGVSEEENLKEVMMGLSMEKNDDEKGNCAVVEMEGGESGNDGERDGEVTESNPVPSSPRKKKFVAKESLKCNFCEKSVYETEKTYNAQGSVFHKSCLRCTVCRTNLSGKQAILDEDSVISSEQYRVFVQTPKSSDSEAGSVAGSEAPGSPRKSKRKSIRMSFTGIKKKKTDVQLLCRQHSNVKDLNPVVGSLKTDVEMSSDLKKEVAQRQKTVAKRMEIEVGDMVPSCAKCGLPLLKGMEISVQGMEKCHVVCPVGEDADNIELGTRHFIKKLPERLILTLVCEKGPKAKPYTFLYEMDAESKNEALSILDGTAIVKFNPDVGSHSSNCRKIKVPKPGIREFSVDIKETELSGFSFLDPIESLEKLPRLNVARSGWLTKRATKSKRNWKLRYFCLFTDGTLTYAEDEDLPPKGIVQLSSDSQIEILRAESGNMLAITGPDQPALYCKAETMACAKGWVESLKEICADLEESDGQEQKDTLPVSMFMRKNGVFQTFQTSFVYSEDEATVESKPCFFKFQMLRGARKRFSETGDDKPKNLKDKEKEENRKKRKSGGGCAVM